jgi:hypothetical protein
VHAPKIDKSGVSVIILQLTGSQDMKGRHLAFSSIFPPIRLREGAFLELRLLPNSTQENLFQFLTTGDKVAALGHDYDIHEFAVKWHTGGWLHNALS